MREMSPDERRALEVAYRWASASEDLSTQNGAVILGRGGRAIAFGRNDIPCASRKPERLERPVKYQWTEHAERAAIYWAACNGICLEGTTMVACWAACTDCARAIRLAGISRLIRHSIPQHADRDDWNQSIAVADEILAEGGVEIVTVTGLIGARIRFNGIVIEV
jgi:dCMP deaminase